MIRCNATTLAALIAICAGASAARADLVTNGGFEITSGDLPVGWSVAGGGISTDSSFVYDGAADTIFTAQSSDASPGVLSQSITTTAGQDYILSFALLDEVGSALDSFSVRLGSFTQDITGDAAPTYTVETFSVPGTDITGTTTTLSFTGANDFAAWNLDAVSLDPASVPEPASASLLGLALMSVPLVRRYRRKGQ